MSSSFGNKRRPVSSSEEDDDVGAKRLRRQQHTDFDDESSCVAEDADDICMICFETFADGSAESEMTVCGHGFCGADCKEKTFNNCDRCPICKSVFKTTLTKMLDGVKSKIPDARYQEILQRIRLDIKSSDELGALKKQRPRSFKMQMAENQKHLRNIAEMIELEGRAAGGGGSSSAAAPPPQQAHQHAAPASRPAGPRPAVSAGSSFPEMPAFGDFSDPWFADARRSLETDPWFAGARSALLAPSLPTPSRAQRGATLPSQAASSSNTAPSEQFIILHALPAHLNRLNGEKVKGRRVAGEPAFKLNSPHDLKIQERHALIEKGSKLLLFGVMRPGRGDVINGAEAKFLNAVKAIDGTIKLRVCGEFDGPNSGGEALSVSARNAFVRIVGGKPCVPHRFTALPGDASSLLAIAASSGQYVVQHPDPLEGRAQKTTLVPSDKLLFPGQTKLRHRTGEVTFVDRVGGFGAYKVRKNGGGEVIVVDTEVEVIHT